MTPYAERQIPAGDVQIFRAIRETIQDLPDIDLGINEDGSPLILSCHILARAVEIVFKCPLKDGWLPPNCDHSWVTTPHDHIIDVYPVGIVGGPILVHNSRCGSPGMWHYKLYAASGRNQMPEHLRILFASPRFKEAVTLVAAALIIVAHAKGLLPEHSIITR